MSKVAVVRIVNDVRRPDYCGNGALDYCIEHGLFHTAFHKGDVLVMSVDKYSSFWCDYTGGDFSKAFFSRRARPNKGFFPSISIAVFVSC